MADSLLAVLVLIFFFLYYISKRKFNYWKKRKIPYLEPVPFLGNYAEFIIQKKYMGKIVQSLCQKFPDAPYVGAFYGTEPTLLVQDLDMIKRIMTKDYYYFSSREISNYTHKEVITKNLFFTYGDRWKVLRQNLTPLFSSSKMRKMFHLIEKCSLGFQDMLNNEYKISNVQEARPLMARFTMDSIGSCAFGINTRTMEKDYKNNDFTNMGTLIFLETYYRGFKVAFRSIWPALFYRLGMKMLPPEVDVFFYKLMTEVFASRQYKPTTRNDFVDLILNIKKDNVMVGDSLNNMKGDNKKVTIEIDNELLVAQCVMFFAAGFETSSTTLHYTLYELAKNQNAQTRAIEEVDEYLKRHNNKLGYECVTELPYVEACFNEALRLYPVLGVITREVVEDYTLPCGAVLEKGVRVHLPVYHMQRHPKYFPDPEQFRPERFLGEEKRNIMPYTYMPFGEGPRICIGMRFAKMQMFVGIITLLKKYQVELAQGTPEKLEFTATTRLTQPTKMIKLRLVEREAWQQRQFT